VTKRSKKFQYDQDKLARWDDEIDVVTDRLCQVFCAEANQADLRWSEGVHVAVALLGYAISNVSCPGCRANALKAVSKYLNDHVSQSPNHNH
jgi:hypothetical protein